jgi:hypothetical protein
MTWTNWKDTRYICLSIRNTPMDSQTHLNNICQNLSKFSLVEAHQTGLWCTGLSVQRV